jgi:hypothetical protein
MWRKEAEMPFTVEEFHDLVRLLEEQPAWRGEVRRLVLTDEVLALPEVVHTLGEVQRRTEEQLGVLVGRVEALVGRVEALAEAQRRTEERLADLTTALQVLTGTVGEMRDEVGTLKGDALERRYRERAPTYFARLVRKARVVSVEEVATLVEAAVGRKQLSEGEAEEILWADLVVRGRRREDGEEVYVVVEVSWGVGLSDVERVVRRAELLGRLGLPVMPVVAGTLVVEEAARLARKLRVWQVTDGRVVPPEQEGR